MIVILAYKPLAKNKNKFVSGAPVHMKIDTKNDVFAKSYEKFHFQERQSIPKIKITSLRTHTYQIYVQRFKKVQ